MIFLKTRHFSFLNEKIKCKHLNHVLFQGMKDFNKSEVNKKYYVYKIVYTISCVL